MPTTSVLAKQEKGYFLMQLSNNQKSVCTIFRGLFIVLAFHTKDAACEASPALKRRLFLAEVAKMIIMNVKKN